MLKKLRVFVFFFCTLPLFAERVEVVQDFTGDPNNSDFPLFNELKKELAERGVECVGSALAKKEASRSIIFWNIPYSIKRSRLTFLPKEKMVLFMWEPPTTQPRMYTKKTWALFSRVYTWDDDLVDGKKFFKFYYPVLGAPLKEEEIPSFEKKKLCTMVITNKQSKHPKELYGEREKIIQFFEAEAAGDFEFYGYGWGPKGYKNYKGAVDNKLQIMKHYRFAICYENMGNIKGYISEKIFDCFNAGTVPVYLGASNVEETIPKNCFVDRRNFKSDAELYAFLRKMEKEEYLRYQANIRKFLQSEEAQLFSMKNYIQTNLESIGLNY